VKLWRAPRNFLLRWIGEGLQWPRGGQFLIEVPGFNLLFAKEPNKGFDENLPWLIHTVVYSSRVKNQFIRLNVQEALPISHTEGNISTKLFKFAHFTSGDIVAA
jgi:hypothetical protein